VTGAVKRVDAVGTGPKRIPTPRAQHAHAQSTVLFLVTGNPAFLGAARRKDAAGDGVADDDVPVAPNAGMQNGIMRRLFTKETNRYERRGRFAMNIFLDGFEDGVPEGSGICGVFFGFGSFAAL